MLKGASRRLDEAEAAWFILLLGDGKMICNRPARCDRQEANAACLLAAGLGK
jgi:hypothetical protein